MSDVIDFEKHQIKRLDEELLRAIPEPSEGGKVFKALIDGDIPCIIRPIERDGESGLAIIVLDRRSVELITLDDLLADNEDLMERIAEYRKGKSRAREEGSCT